MSDRFISKFIIDVDKKDINFTNILYTKIFMILEYFEIESNDNNNILIMEDKDTFKQRKELIKYLN